MFQALYPYGISISKSKAVTELFLYHLIDTPDDQCRAASSPRASTRSKRQGERSRTYRPKSREYTILTIGTSATTIPRLSSSHPLLVPIDELRGFGIGSISILIILLKPENK
jgi:hypothetical protein